MKEYRVRWGVDARQYYLSTGTFTAKEALCFANAPGANLPDLPADQDGTETFDEVETIEILDADKNCLLLVLSQGAGCWTDAESNPVTFPLAYLQSLEPNRVGAYAAQIRPTEIPREIEPAELERLRAIEAAARELLAGHDGPHGFPEPSWYEALYQQLRAALGQ